MFDKNFYPTPENVISKMLEKIDFEEVKYILEPSAGSGAIIKKLILEYQKFSIDAVESNLELCSILKNIKLQEERDKYGNWVDTYVNIAGYDFLSFSTYKKYDAVIMNPPFDNGAKHLLKALDLMQDGGQIVCLLNSETLLNPYSNERKSLLHKLSQLNADIEDLGQCFRNAERSTNINISMVYVKIAKKYNNDSYLFNHIQEEIRQEELEYNEDESNEIVIHEPIQQLIDRYNLEIKSGIKFINEFYKVKSHISLDISLSCNNINEFIENTRMKYWLKLLDNDILINKMTSKAREEYQQNINKTKYFEFNKINIYQTILNVINNIDTTYKNELVKLFDHITFQSSFNEFNNNTIHLFNGWKTNKAYKADKKFILKVFFPYGNTVNLKHEDTKIASEIVEIEKILAWLNYEQNTVNINSIKSKIINSIANNNLKNIETNYFIINIYKKGTVHFQFKDENLLKRFNMVAAQNKNWLPPCYGKKAYNEMNQEEQSVIDSFEGESNYKQSCLILQSQENNLFALV